MTMLFIGPLWFLAVTFVAILVLLVLARLVFALAWRVILVGAIVLGLLWLIGTPGRAPVGTVPTAYHALSVVAIGCSTVSTVPALEYT